MYLCPNRTIRSYGLHVLVLGLACGLLGQGCRGLARHTAMQAMGDIVASGAPAYARETDPALAAPALAANIKFLEALLESEPHQPTLLLHTIQGLATYTYVVVEGQLATARLEAPQAVAFQTRRAQQLYDRGLHYGLRLLSRYHGVWQQALDLDPPVLATHLQQLPVEAVPALFWTAFCWSGTLNMARDDLETIAALPRLEALLARLIGLDETYFYGAPHLLMAVHHASRAPALGGNPNQAQYHFARARELGQDRLLLVFLLEAQYYAVQIQDRTLFKSRLQQVLDASDAFFPPQALLNIVAKQRARLLLRQIENLFV